MPGILGLIGLPDVPDSQFQRAADTLDLLGRRPAASFGDRDARLAVATMPDPPLEGPFHHDDDDVTACFAGDLHDCKSIPWPDIARCCREDSLAWTDAVDGYFAVAVYDRRRRRLQLFADHFGWQPIFFVRHGRGLVFSTQLAAFVRLGVGGDFDQEWFHRFLFFGYWPGTSTYLAGVKRLRPGTVLTFDLDSGVSTVRSYEEPYARITPPLRGREAVDKAMATFRARVPGMFDGDRRVQFGLSGGLDSRTIYAFLPPGVDHAAFTYGRPDCGDHREAAFTARKLGIPHRQLFFDEQYEKTIPSQIYETVWLSGGLAWINRCMLPSVYRFVAAEDGPSPILSSGIALDTLFRGHNNGRGDVHLLLATGEARFTEPAYAQLLPDEALPRFKESVRSAVDDLTREHGRLSDSEAYLSYTAYTLCPSYFTADLEIGGHYATLRVPGFDQEIVKLAYELEYSTIFLSKFIPHDYFDEFILQANLMCSHPRLARIPHRGIPLDVYVRGDRMRYRFYRLFTAGPRVMRRKLFGERPGIENWDAWFPTLLAADMQAILGPEARVRQFLRPGAVETYLAENRWVWTARLASVEVVLQLMANDWNLEQLPYPGVRPAVRI